MYNMDFPSLLDNVGPTTVFVSVTIILATTAWLLALKSTYPPGPRPLPILGSLLSLVCQKDPSKFITSLGNTYGPVCLLWIGSQPIVLLNSWEVIKEAFISKAGQFSDRPTLYVMRKNMKGNSTGILLSNGDTHKALRRFTLMGLHNFGLGKQSLECKIQEEAVALVSHLESTSGQPISDMKKMVQLAVVNIIVSVCFGSRLSHDDEDFVTIMNLLDMVFSRPVFLHPHNFIPLTRLLPLGSTAKISDTSGKKLNEYISKQIQCHRESFDCNHLRDFIDIYLKADIDGDCHLTTDNLFVLVLDLFVGGSETTVTSLMWAVLYLMKYPQIQLRAQKDIDNLLGKDRVPTAKDREKLVYVEAIMNEVMRMASVVFLSVPRYVSEEGVFLGGFELPRGSWVFPTMVNVHMNENYWKDPQVFRPERWINDSGELINHDYYMPFSIGKRNCLGETLAKIEAFIILTMLLQRFTFEVPPGASMPSSDESVIGITRAPLPFQVCVVARK